MSEDNSRANTVVEFVLSNFRIVLRQINMHSKISLPLANRLSELQTEGVVFCLSLTIQLVLSKSCMSD
jgi:hypothetical protein